MPLSNIAPFMRTAALLLSTAGMIAGSTWAERARNDYVHSHSDEAGEPLSVTYCDLAKDPKIYNHALVRLTAFVTHGFEDFSL
ncbi:MAG: hypothetical protein M3P45_09460, partial [Acidobacteriota bacterium]|nr:hypothetical protein [Acidobacteriota bacterium]